MKIWQKVSGTVAVAIAVLALLLVAAVLWAPGESPVARSYTTGIYFDEGGNRMVVQSGGQLVATPGATLSLPGVSLGGASAEGIVVAQPTAAATATPGIYSNTAADVPDLQVWSKDATPEVYIHNDGTFDLNGNKLDLDADADTSIVASTDDQIDVEISGANDFQFTANVFKAASGSSIETDTIDDTSESGLSITANTGVVGTLTTGTDGSGTDVTFYSATGGDTLTWDASEEQLIVTGTNGQTALNVADGNVVIADNFTMSAGVATLPVNVEHIGIPSVITVAVTYQSSGAIATIGDGEIWRVEAVYFRTAADFNCTGDDCTLQIGDGGDANGLLDLVDAELQAAAVDITGGAAGWHGYDGDTIGAYLAAGGGFIYAPSGAAETIDIVVGGTDPAAGSGTLYIVYTRIL